MQQHADVGRKLLAGSGSELLELAAAVAWTCAERGQAFDPEIVDALVAAQERSAA